MNKSNVSPWFSEATKRMHKILISNKTNDHAFFERVKIVGFEENDKQLNIIFHLGRDEYVVVQFYTDTFWDLSNEQIVDSIIWHLTGGK